MFLTQLCLNRLNRNVMKTLTDVYRLHQTVMKGFTAYEDVERVLFRVEPEVRSESVVVLVQSAVAPDWRFAEENNGIAGARVKEFSPSFRKGDLFRFRLRANPTVTRNGKRYGLIRDDDLLDWLRQKEEKLGVRLTSATVIDEGYISGKKRSEKGNHRLDIKTARFEGVLKVVEPELVGEAFSTGIGPAKAFGCGLLSLART